MTTIMKGAPLTPLVPGFDDPLGLILSCHIRIEQRCALLKRIAEHLAKHGADVQARQSCTHVLRYFDDAGIKHHEDEEHDLFPMLLDATAPAARKKLKAVIEQLTAQHQQMHDIWTALRAVLLDIEAGRSALLDAELIDRFQTLYVAHIAIEEHDILPLARERFSPQAIERLGRSMAARRNVKFPA